MAKNNIPKYQRLLWLSISIIVLNLTLGVAQANPSFDCSKAGISVEYMICNDAELSSLDTQVAEMYTQLRTQLVSQKKQQQEIILEQRQFLKERSSKCLIPKELSIVDEKLGNYRQCLINRYSERLAILNEQLSNASYNHIEKIKAEENTSYKENNDSVTSSDSENGNKVSAFTIFIIVFTALLIWNSRPPFDKKLLTDNSEPEEVRRDKIKKALVKKGYIIQHQEPGMITAMKRKANFYFIEFVILSFLFLIPGILYLIHYMTKRDKIIQYIIEQDKKPPKIIYPQSYN